MRYKTRGTCSSAIEIEVEDDIVRHVKFIGGCRGNTEGVARLVVGRKTDDVISLLKGIPCQGTTSCPDQLARALEQMKAARSA
ncbi:MAG: TIGR03905 family TSCPD domain-containing protein [Clostridia bacterium]